MSCTIIDPTYWSAQRIISYGPDTIHELALKAAGTVNAYRLVLGRCLLAVERTKLYQSFGCSGAVNYGTLVLGLPTNTARSLRWVAQKLEGLPQLSRAAQTGELDWSKVRAVVRKATEETEGLWLELCRGKSSRDVALLARYTPVGAVPGDLPSEGEREPAITEFRIHLGETARTVVERGLQVYSLKQGRPVPLAEALELLFSQLIERGEVSGGSGACEELDDLARSQQEARKDLLAQSLRRDPLVQEARALARAMGMGGKAEAPTGDEATHEYGVTHQGDDVADAVLPLSDIYGELMASIDMAMPDHSTRNADAESTDNSARNESNPGLRAEPRQNGSAGNDSETSEHSARNQSNAGHNVEPMQNGAPPEMLEVQERDASEHSARNAQDWQNPRLRFNPEARVPTDAQRRELLRRDGYCCSTPGCPNHLWLETHHVVFHSRKGETLPRNLVTLCSRCHKNVHDGHLRITGEAPDGLVFQDRHGNDLRRLHDLGVAGWLNFWIGWNGSLEDSHQHRLAKNFATSGAPAASARRAPPMSKSQPLKQ